MLARWQEFVGTGELLRQVESGVARLRDRVTAAIKGSRRRAATSARRCRPASRRWSPRRRRPRRDHGPPAGGSCPAAPQLVTAHPELAEASPDLPSERRASGARLAGRRPRPRARARARTGAPRRASLSYGVNGIGVVLMLVAFASTVGLTGAEVGIAGGTALLGPAAARGASSATRRSASWRPRPGTSCCAGPPSCTPASRPGTSRSSTAVTVDPKQAQAPVGRRSDSGGSAMSPLKMGARPAAGVGRRASVAAVAALGEALETGAASSTRRWRPRRGGSSTRIGERTRSPATTPSSRSPGAPAAGSPACSTTWSGRRRDGRGPPPDDLDPDGGRVGRRMPPPRCSTGSRSAARHHVGARDRRRTGSGLRRPGAARPARLRLAGAGAPPRGRPGARARRRVRLGDRPPEVRRRPAARRVLAAARRARRRDRSWSSTRRTG